MQRPQTVCQGNEFKEITPHRIFMLMIGQWPQHVCTNRAISKGAGKDKTWVVY